MSDDVTIPREMARVLYDLIIGSLDWGSGFLSSDEMRQVQALAMAIGDVPLVRCDDAVWDDPPAGVTYCGDRACIRPMGHDGGHEYDLRPVCKVGADWTHSPTRLPATGDRWRSARWWPRSIVRPSYKGLA